MLKPVRENTSGYLIPLAGIIILLVFTKIERFNGLYGNDSYEYTRYTIALKEFFTTGISPGKFSWPVIYPLTGALLSFVFDTVFSLQLISIFAFAGTLNVLYKMLKLLLSEKPGDWYFIILFGFLSPYFLRLSVCVMSDMLAVYFYMAGFYFVLKYHLLQKNKDFFLAGIFSLLALFTHYSAALVLILPLILSSMLFFRRFKILPFILLLIILFAIGISLKTIQPDLFSGALHHPLLERWSFKNFFLSQFNYEDGLQSYRFPNILFVVLIFIHPGFCFPGIVFLSHMKQTFGKIKFMFIVLLSVTFYLLFLMGTPNQNTRLLTLVFPLLLLLYARPFQFMMEKYFSSVIKRNLLYVSVVAAQVILFLFAFRGINTLNKNEKLVAEKCMEYNSDKTIYTLSIDGALKIYGVKNKIINLWDTKVSVVDSNSLILVNEKELEEQWQGKLPMINWVYIRTNYKLKRVELKAGDWTLYECN